LPACPVHERQSAHWPVFFFREPNLMSAVRAVEVRGPDGSPPPNFRGRMRRQTLRAMALVWTGRRTGDWVNVGFGVALWIAAAFLWLDRRRRWLACTTKFLFLCAPRRFRALAAGGHACVPG